MDVVYYGDDDSDAFLIWSYPSADLPERPRQAERFVKRLQRLAPHIRWRIKLEEHELGTYPALVVPEEQLEEAEKILQLVEQGKVRSRVKPWHLYPTLYVRKGTKWMLHPAAQGFRNLVSEFGAYLLAGATDAATLANLMVTLAELCRKVHDLPDASPPECGDLDGYCLIDLRHFGPLEVYKYASPYGDDDLKEYSLTDDLMELYEILERGATLYDEGTPSAMLEALRYWRWEYRWSWGKLAARVLAALSSALFYKSA